MNGTAIVSSAGSHALGIPMGVRFAAIQAAQKSL